MKGHVSHAKSQKSIRDGIYLHTLRQEESSWKHDKAWQGLDWPILGAKASASPQGTKVCILSRTEEQRLRSRIIGAERWHVWCLNLGETLDCDGHGLSVRWQDSGNEPRHMWRPLQIDPPRPSADSVLWHIQCCVSSEFSFSHQWAQKYRTDWY